MTAPRRIAGGLAVAAALAMVGVMPFVRGGGALNGALLVLFTLVIAGATLGPVVVWALPFGSVMRGTLLGAVA
jgi:hypothetical protein